MFNDIMTRDHSTTTWQKIPWNDPEFSERMLKEHLSQEHDAASRRMAIVERHVDWIHNMILEEKPAKILDLGCGPGFYTGRLQALGHDCTGIDFSPASIAYAKENTPECTYIQGDLRERAYGEGYDLVMMVFGEINTFSPEEAQNIIHKIFDALKPGGTLLLEPHTYEAVRHIGEQPARWYTSQSGLFSTRPHICLEESFFENDRAVDRYFVIDAETGETTLYASTTQAYTVEGYHKMLNRFNYVKFYPTLTGERTQDELRVIVARK